MQSLSPNILALLPEFILTIVGVLIMLVEPLLPSASSRKPLGWFAIAGTVYGCDIGTVREIVPVRRATRLPGAPDYVRGLINLRGAIVTVIDLSRRVPAWQPGANREMADHRQAARSYHAQPQTTSRHTSRPGPCDTSARARTNPCSA